MPRRNGWDVTRWYAGWQCALWAASAGFAAWLMWDDLSATQRELVRKMVETEANRFNSDTVPYYRDRKGEFRYPGNSKGEENAWNAMVLQVATAMMPHHPAYRTWMNKCIELELSAAARPVDVTSATVINGRRLSSWLNGSNVCVDGTVVNHNRVHPVYTKTVAVWNAHAALTYSLAGKPTPQAARRRPERAQREGSGTAGDRDQRRLRPDSRAATSCGSVGRASSPRRGGSR